MSKFRFFPLDCPSRNEFLKTFFGSKYLQKIFWLCNSNEFSKNFKSFNFPLEADAGKVYTEFLKTFFRYCGWKFQVRRHFAFAIATLPLFQHSENVKISIFPIILSQEKNAVSSKVFNEFSKFSFGWKTRKVAILVENFKSTDVLVFH